MNQMIFICCLTVAFTHHVLISDTVVFRMTLLLGPPTSGKTTLLLALAGKLDRDLKVCYQILFTIIIHSCSCISIYSFIFSICLLITWTYSQVSGKVTYCGHELNEFIPQRTCAYISQHDLHHGEMTVRETLDFSGRCLGVGTRYEMLAELSRREREAGIKPDPEIDAFMKATAMSGQETSLVTDYVLKVHFLHFKLVHLFSYLTS